MFALLTALSTLAVLAASGCTVDSKEDLAQTAQTRMAEAVYIAEATVPGLAVTAEITMRDGTLAYVVEVVDERGTEHVAYVDAHNGEMVEIDGDNYTMLEAPGTERGSRQVL